MDTRPKTNLFEVRVRDIATGESVCGGPFATRYEGNRWAEKTTAALLKSGATLETLQYDRRDLREGDGIGLNWD